MTTHLVEFSNVVVKRFRSYERGEHRREWLGLRLLDRYAPGLAPRPLAANLAADPPTVTMSRLPGEPLGGRPLTPAELSAVAEAMDRLHSAVPADDAVAPAVLGREDHNLPNFLRDGDRIALVDFEDSGRSDRATEWAALAEHHAARCTADADWQVFLGTVADQRRLRAARRYYACVWVALRLPGRPGHDRNPPQARRAQAERLLGLL